MHWSLNPRAAPGASENVCGQLWPVPQDGSYVSSPNANRDLDLLFVIDDSPGMADKQQNLKYSFQYFIEDLRLRFGGLPNLHIGVVSTDMGTKTSGSATPAPPIGQGGQGGCSGTGKGGALQTGTASIVGRYLSDIAQPDGTRLVNYQGALDTALGQLVSLGAGGCGFEQPLAAMRAALDNHPANAGFLRPQAMLGVIFLTDEDDCSAKSPDLFDASGAQLGPLQSFRCTRYGVTCATGGQTPDAMNQAGAKSDCAPSVGSAYLDDVAPYSAFLDGLKEDPRRLIVGAIQSDSTSFAVELRQPPGGGLAIPALAHSCFYTGAGGLEEVGDPAVRLTALLDRFQGRSTYATICQRDVSAALILLTVRMQSALMGSCVVLPLVDTDARASGIQPDCIVEDVVGATVTPVPACDSSPAAQPCWRIQPNVMACELRSPPPHLQLEIVRGTAPDPATVTRARCQIEP